MSFLETAIGWLAPPVCLGCGAEDMALCADCSNRTLPLFGERCWRCNRLSPGCRACASCRRAGSPKYVFVRTSYENMARNLLALYKFGHQRAAAGPIARLMLDNMLRYASLEDISAKNYLVVPVPTATKHIRERGFGHSELLARTISLKLRAEQTNALRRLGQTRQLGAKREARLVQLKGSFAVKNPRRVHGRNILLIDDVVTTGGTISAATGALKSAGAQSVDALLFAKRL